MTDCEQFHLSGLSGYGAATRIQDSRGTISGLSLNESFVVLDRSVVTMDRCSVSGLIISIPLSIVDSDVHLTRSSFSMPGNTFPVVVNASTVHLDPTVSMGSATTGSVCSSSSSTGCAEQLSPVTSLVASVAPGQLSFNLHAEVGDLTATLIAFPSPVSQTPLGDLWVAPDAHLVVDTTTLTSRERRIDVPIVSGVPTGLNVVLQSVTLGPAGPRLSNGAIVSLR